MARKVELPRKEGVAPVSKSMKIFLNNLWILFFMGRSVLEYIVIGATAAIVGAGIGGTIEYFSGVRPTGIEEVPSGCYGGAEASALLALVIYSRTRRRNEIRSSVDWN